MVPDIKRNGDNYTQQLQQSPHCQNAEASIPETLSPEHLAESHAGIKVHDSEIDDKNISMAGDVGEGGKSRYRLSEKRSLLQPRKLSTPVRHLSKKTVSKNTVKHNYSTQLVFVDFWNWITLLKIT